MTPRYFPPIVPELSGLRVDIESQVARKEGCCRAIGGFFRGCVESVKNAAKACWKKLPTGVKDSIEISGLTASAVGSGFMSNGPVAALLTGAAAEHSTDITLRHRYYLKLLIGGTLFTGYKLLNDNTGVGVWTLSLGLLLYLAHTTLNDLAVATGRKSDFAQRFNQWPVRLQSDVIEKVEIIRLQAEAALRAGHYADGVEMGSAVDNKS